MSFIYTTDIDYRNIKSQYSRKLPAYFAAVHNGGKSRDIITLSRSACRAINLDKWCKVGYDAESKIMRIVPLAEEQKGALWVSQGGADKVHQKINVSQFFKHIGAEDLPRGRFRVKIELDRSAAIVYFNDKL